MCLPVPSRLLKDTVAVLFAAVLLGLACSRSGLKTTADAGVASGGQAGSTISSVATGGASGMIGPGGAGDANIGGTGGVIGSGGSSGTGGTAGSSGTGGTGGQGPICAAYPMCNPGDQQVGMDCPSGRECYTLSVSCGSGRYNTITCAYGAEAGVPDASARALDTGVDVRMIAALCGNGVLDPGEQCDDGNARDGDGCSATCQIEASWCLPLPGQTCMGLPRCGNGVLTSNEACDDGNTVSGDGCSGDCQTIEPGWQCRVPGKPCTRICGNQLDGSVSCDGGSDQGAQCGDGIVETGEECDCGDGTIPVPGECPGPNNDSTYGGCTTRCTWGTFCGDGIVNGPEQCDLGKLNGSDLGPNGCTFGCMRFRNCGDGIVETGEECDCGDGTVPVSASCPGPNGDITYGGCKTDCTRGPHCGDGILDLREECDCGSPDPVSGQAPCSYCTPDCKLLNM
jgi:cysteine-rich repeat protein